MATPTPLGEDDEQPLNAEDNQQQMAPPKRPINEEEVKKSWTRFWKTYVFYYFAQLIVTVTCLAFYAVMAFSPHVPCVDENSKANATTGVVIAFIIGFSLHCIVFVTESFYEVILRGYFRKGVKEFGLNSDMKTTLYLTEMIDFSFRLVFILFSLYQMAVIGSPGVRQCIEENALTVEAAYMGNLALAQLATVPTFMLWRFLVKQGDYSDENKKKKAPPVPVDEAIEDPWRIDERLSFESRERRRKTQEQREKRNKKFDKKFADPRALINSRLKKGENEKGKQFRDDGEKIIAHDAFQYTDYKKIEKKLNDGQSESDSDAKDGGPSLGGYSKHSISLKNSMKR